MHIMCMCGAAGMYIIITLEEESQSSHFIYCSILSSFPASTRVYRREPGRVHYVRIHLCACVCVCERAHVTSWFIDTTMSMVIKVEKRGADVPSVRRQRRSCVSSSSSSISSPHYTSVCMRTVLRRWCLSTFILYYMPKYSAAVC
jgi:hypothetical protein